MAIPLENQPVQTSPTITTSTSLALRLDKEAVEVEVGEVAGELSPWLNRHLCCHVHWILSPCLQAEVLEKDFEVGKVGLLFSQK